mmetsp:Transcript_4218/g.7161  ORF Transcript_4218/g.7161 Transcript_4218/m.7161 type:complete len:117 (-) Transcript_4218:517-867(-)
MRATKIDPNVADPDIAPEEFKRMQSSVQRFAQALQIGKYKVAQEILNDHRLDVEKYFPETHVANLSVINNQAMLHKLNGKYTLAKEMFENVSKAYEEIYGQMHPSTINCIINLATA